MSGGPTLIVDPAVLSSAATAFAQAGAQLTGLGADAPLGEAGAAVPQLATASACQQAQSAVAAGTGAAADAATTFGDNLIDAAQRYEAQDHAAADSIEKCRVPGS
ncbi:hypothetical protein L2K20_29380 [Mycobacterium sp. MBM]|nr:hypothetical protein [Mycobacterium sp. MBM]